MLLRAFLRCRVIDRELPLQPQQEPLSIHVDTRREEPWEISLNSELSPEDNVHPDVVLLQLAKREPDGTRLYHECSPV